jgi:hypothetical protein
MPISMEVVMVKRTQILAGSLGLLIFTVAAPRANAADVVTGWGAFRPFPNFGSQDCVVHQSGGALNQCGSGQTLIFDLPILEQAPNPVTHSITARSFGSSSTAFQCQAVALNATGTNVTLGTAVSFAATSSIDTKTFNVVVPTGWSLRLQCTNVPNNKGILRLRWTPQTLT